MVRSAEAILWRWLNRAAQKGWIRFDQYSPLRRLAITLYLLRSELWQTMGQVTHPYRALWSLLTGKDTYYLHLAGKPPCFLRFSPLIFLNFLRLLRAVYPTLAINPDESTLAIAIAPDVPYTAYLSDTADLAVLKELLIEQVYGTHFPGYKIIDVGAYRGETALFFCACGAESVIAAEPAPDNYAIAQKNILASPYHNRIKILPVAVSDAKGTMTMRLNLKNPYAHSLQETSPSADSAEVVPVEVWSFKDLIAYSSWEVIDLVKLDCEGAEYPILLNTPAEILQRVKRWAIEYHGPVEPLRSRLKELGYQVRHVQDRGTIGILHAERISEA